MAAENLLRACAPLCWVGRGRALGRRRAAPGVVTGSLFTPHCGVATSPRELGGVWGGKRPGAAAGLSSASCGRRGGVAAGSPGSDGRALTSSGTRRPPWALCSRDTRPHRMPGPGCTGPRESAAACRRRRLRGLRRRDAPVSAPAAFSLVPLKSEMA